MHGDDLKYGWRGFKMGRDIAGREGGGERKRLRVGRIGIYKCC